MDAGTVRALSPPRPPTIWRPAAPQNFGSRGGLPVDMLVLHTTESTAKSALNWFADSDAHASAHFLVGQDGTIWHCVDLDRAAWHAGNGGVNRRSIGIECEGESRRAEMWSPALVASLCALVRWLVIERSIPADRSHLIGHDEVPDPRTPGRFGGLNHHTDPGIHCPWAAIMAAALSAATGRPPEVLV